MVKWRCDIFLRLWIGTTTVVKIREKGMHNNFFTGNSQRLLRAQRCVHVHVCGQSQNNVRPTSLQEISNFYSQKQIVNKLKNLLLKIGNTTHENCMHLNGSSHIYACRSGSDISIYFFSRKEMFLSLVFLLHGRWTTTTGFSFFFCSWATKKKLLYACD